MTNVAAATSAREPDVSVDEAPRGRGPATGSSRRRVVPGGRRLIGVQLAVRGWVAASGYFWQDDLIVDRHAPATGPLFTSDFLLYDHDGHFMPAGFLLTGVCTELAPLEWWPMVVSLVLLQALASWRSGGCSASCSATGRCCWRRCCSTSSRR